MWQAQLSKRTFFEGVIWVDIVMGVYEEVELSQVEKGIVDLV
jgi:hypothetical protein